MEFSKREAEIKSLIETGSDILKKKIDSLSLESTSLKVQKPFNKDLNEAPPTQPIIHSNVDAVSVGEIMHETPLNIDLGGDEDELFSRKIEEKFAADTLSKLTDLASSSQQSAESTSASGISAKLDENSLNRIRERQEKAVEKKKQQIEKAQLAKVQQQIPKPSQHPTRPVAFAKPSVAAFLPSVQTSAIKKPAPIELVMTR